jgi:hypothetical protein
MTVQIQPLIEALMTFDALAARQWVADAQRLPIQWSQIALPKGLSAERMAVTAGVVELLAQRAGQPSPGWTADVPKSPQPIYLVRAAESMPRLRRLCEEQGPEPLRKRQVMAPPEFLTLA